MTAVVALVAAVALTAVLALFHRRNDGRLKTTRRLARQSGTLAGESGTLAGRTGGANDTREDLRPLLPNAGERATLLQFSSAFCAPCRATRRVLSEIAAVAEGVAYVEIDAESNLELVRRLHILKTPTTLVLDQQGREVVRASGQPRKSEVLSALGQAVVS